jgi:Mce-associated membrane protein
MSIRGPMSAGAEAGQRRIGLLVVVLALVLLAGFLGWRLLEKNGLVAAGADAEAAGRAAATNMLTYDYTSLDQDFAWVVEDGTTTFTKTFSDTADNVKELAEATSAHSEVEIRDAGVHVTDEDQATVLVAADQTITEADKAAEEVQRWRIKLTLVKHDGRWLVDRLDLL